jgi:hypothetical protein
MLANVYLHYCFDLWAERWRQRQARGNVTYVRYADDIVGASHLPCAGIGSCIRRLSSALRDFSRRRQKDSSTWERIERLAAAFLPPPRILHPWPEARFLVKHPRWKPSA